MQNKDFKKILWQSADKLRYAMDAAEYKHIVLGLLFLKYLSDAFESQRVALRKQFADPNHEYYLGTSDEDEIVEELEDRDYYNQRQCLLGTRKCPLANFAQWCK